MSSRYRSAGVLIALLAAIAVLPLKAQKLPLNPGVQRRTTPEARNVRLVAWTDMDGRPDALQVVGQGNYLYVGHFWSHGVSIIDISDPAKPRVVKFIPAPANAWHINVQVGGNLMLIASEQDSWTPTNSGPPASPGARLFDISDPRNPVELTTYKVAGRGTHRNFYAGGKYAYLSSSKSDYNGNVLEVIDVSDPRNPRHVSEWGPDTKSGEPRDRVFLHAPLVPGDRAYLGYLSDAGPGGAVLDISNIQQPKLLSSFRFNPPFGNVHTFLPLPTRKLAVAIDESLAYACREPMKLSWIMDLQDEAHPRPLSILPLPDNYQAHCGREVRNGPHNIHENRPGSMVDEFTVYLAAFNWGVRVYDISNPFRPEEVGYYVPEDPKWRMDQRKLDTAKGEGSDLISMQDVYVDARGYMYATDYNGGLYVLQYTGPKPKGPSADPRGSWRPGLK